MIGLLRAITTEMSSSRFASIDVEHDFDYSDAKLASIVLAKEVALQTEEQLSVDGEYIMNNGTLNVSRLVPNEAANSRFRR